GVQRNVKNKLRPYVGLLLEIDGHNYYAPLSSYKPKFRKKNHTFFKVYEDTTRDPVAVIKFNCMIPVLESEITYIDFAQHPDKKYRSLLEAEYRYIKANRTAILEGAKKLYALANKGQGFFYEGSCKFKLLESVYQNFTNPVSGSVNS
ncbi:type III toxin-antitoxin system ToxN/AbiQ family toxin, partial [Bacillus subtilis]|uniref:type III toxin-antitoxin system ToxN/AbiQ family toxin n=1 Tax=Bacillus subtilis TaxID=1423 RepID=UPI003F7C63C8